MRTDILDSSKAYPMIMDKVSAGAGVFTNFILFPKCVSSHKDAHLKTHWVHDMKKILLFILVLTAIAGVCVVTCPDKEAHTEALKEELSDILTEELSRGGNKPDMVMLGSIIGTGFGGLVIDNMLKVNNYFVCSIGTVTLDGKTRVVSIGVLNHVFTPDKKDIEKAVQNKK